MLSEEIQNKIRDEIQAVCDKYNVILHTVLYQQRFVDTDGNEVLQLQTRLIVKEKENDRKSTT